jgi:transcriptional regulator of heat shock response
MDIMITERQEEILNRIVQEYIDSAQPISSQLLEKKYDFGISPATIRIEMQKLTKAGYLYQPHTSAGRVPTDKGYRFFVDNIFKKGYNPSLVDSRSSLRSERAPILEFEDKIEEILKEEKEDILKWASRLTKFLAEESSSFTILQLLERDFLLKEGWEEILKEPEFKEKDLVFDFVGFLENFEENIKNLKINSEIKIYIGRESPFPGAKNFSIILSKCYFPEEAILSLLGPKRMAYDRNIGLINSLKRLLDDL